MKIIIRTAILGFLLGPILAPGWNSRTYAQADLSTKDAFEAAKELNTPDGWKAFIANFPSGFYADLARAYLKKLDPASAAADPARPSAPPANAKSTASAPSKTRPRAELGANA